MSFIPISLSNLIEYSIKGLLLTSKRGLGLSFVKGKTRLPNPAHNIIAFFISIFYF